MLLGPARVAGMTPEVADAKQCANSAARSGLSTRLNLPSSEKGWEEGGAEGILFNSWSWGCASGRRHCWSLLPLGVLGSTSSACPQIYTHSAAAGHAHPAPTPGACTRR